MPLQDFSSSSILTNESSMDTTNKNTNTTASETHSDNKVCTNKYKCFFITEQNIFFLLYNYITFN